MKSVLCAVSAATLMQLSLAAHAGWGNPLGIEEETAPAHTTPTVETQPHPHTDRARPVRTPIAPMTNHQFTMAHYGYTGKTGHTFKGRGH